MNSVKTIVAAGALALLAGCNTESAKKAMAKPMPTDQYSGFDRAQNDKNKRTAELPKPVSDATDPEQAVSQLVDQLQKPYASFSVTAEDQLNYWGSKPGVASIVVRKVRPLLKSPKVEQRAPALRLTVAFGNRESVGDLIECLGDSEYGIREMAFKALQGMSPRDYGYEPSGGTVARAQSMDMYRNWWQTEQRRSSVQPPSIYENKLPAEATVSAPGARKPTADYNR